MLAQTEEDKELICLYCLGTNCKCAANPGEVEWQETPGAVWMQEMTPISLGGWMLDLLQPMHSWESQNLLAGSMGLPSLPREALGVSSSPVPAQTPHKSRRHLENITPTTTKGGQGCPNPPPEVSIQLILEPPQEILLLPFEAQRQEKLIAALVLTAASHHTPHP